MAVQKLVLDQLKNSQDTCRTIPKLPVARLHEITDDEESISDFNAVKNLDTSSPIKGEPEDTATTSKVIQKRHVKCASRTLGSFIELESLSWLHTFDMTGSFYSWWDEYQSTYSLFASWRFPALLGRRVLSFELKLRQYVMGQHISIPRCSLMVVQYVREDSAIAVACRMGDEAAVRRLLRERQANPNDVIEIDSGYLEPSNLLQVFSPFSRW